MPVMRSRSHVSTGLLLRSPRSTEKGNLRPAVLLVRRLNIRMHHRCSCTVPQTRAHARHVPDTVHLKLRDTCVGLQVICAVTCFAVGCAFIGLQHTGQRAVAPVMQVSSKASLSTSGVLASPEALAILHDLQSHLPRIRPHDAAGEINAVPEFHREPLQSLRSRSRRSCALLSL